MLESLIDLTKIREREEKQSYENERIEKLFLFPTVNQIHVRPRGVLYLKIERTTVKKRPRIVRKHEKLSFTGIGLKLMKRWDMCRMGEITREGE